MLDYELPTICFKIYTYVFLCIPVLYLTTFLLYECQFLTRSVITYYLISIYLNVYLYTLCSCHRTVKIDIKQPRLFGKRKYIAIEHEISSIGHLRSTLRPKVRHIFWVHKIGNAVKLVIGYFWFLNECVLL